MTVSNNSVTALGYYVGRNLLTRPVANGVVAVFEAESGTNPTAKNDTGTDAGGVLNPNGAIGIAQWNGPRQAALQSFANAQKTDPLALETQLAFFLFEAERSYAPTWAALKPGTPVATVIQAMVTDYERPKDAQGEIGRATSIADQLALVVIPPAPTPITDPELVAIQEIWLILSSFDKVTSTRILAYLTQRVET